MRVQATQDDVRRLAGIQPRSGLLQKNECDDVPDPDFCDLLSQITWNREMLSFGCMQAMSPHCGVGTTAKLAHHCATDV